MRAPITLLLYTRRDCCLCDSAKEDLAALARELPIRIEERDVDARDEWRRAYGDDVPVGTIDGSKVFKYRVEPARLSRAVRARLHRR